MQYLEFREQLKYFVVFSLDDIRKIETPFHRQRLNEWQKKGYIKKVINEYYIFSDLEINEQILFIIANKIFDPSYISTESALSFYGMIPEGVYSVTSVTSRKTYVFKSSLAQFSYRKIRPELIFGYKLVRHKEHVFKMAEIEKALLDYFYFNSKIKTEGQFAELRINKDAFERIDLKKLENYLIQFDNKAMEKRVNKFIKFMRHA
ncbi:MAG: hypothetical protein Q8L10_05700 [Candidatus Moranbacteria bacterium]|nr:hypothetical protein [Candidatus Moranbacteria bacterium]